MSAFVFVSLGSDLVMLFYILFLQKQPFAVSGRLYLTARSSSSMGS